MCTTDPKILGQILSQSTATVQVYGRRLKSRCELARGKLLGERVKLKGERSGAGIRRWALALGRDVKSLALVVSQILDVSRSVGMVRSSVLLCI